ncbi:MAG: FtsX-like permease family protein, partial [Bacteroidota bacterium]
MAKKYFLDGDPVGQTINLDGNVTLNIAGIIQDSPKNTNLPFLLVVSLPTLKEKEPRIWQNWGMTWSYSTYIIPEKGVSVKALEEKIDEVFDAYAYVEEPEEGETSSFILQPLKQIHTDEKYGDENHYVTPSLMIYAFIFLASLILGTACLNFININTSIAVRRSKEIGIRKTLGGIRKQLFLQFLFETFITVCISMAIAFTIGQILIDGFNKSLTIIAYDLAYDTSIIYFAIICILLVTVTAGAYPAMILSGFQPVEAIKNQITLKKGSGNFNLRRVLIVTQFAFTSILIICTLIVAEQVDFVKNRDAGFNSKGVYLLDLPTSTYEKRSSFINHLISKPFVSDVSLAYNAPLAGYGWNNTFDIPGKESKENQNASLKFIDDNYINFYGIQLLAGQNLKNETINDSTYHVLINQHMVTFAD